MPRLLALSLPGLLLAACQDPDEPEPASASRAESVREGGGEAAEPPEEPGNLDDAGVTEESGEPTAAGEAEPPEGGATSEAVEVDGALYAGTLEDPVPIDIDYLGAWQFEMKEDPFPEHVRAIDGKYVRIKGFMLPDVDFEDIEEWHLVRSLWGCCFGAPPRINEIVRVSVPGEGMDYTYNTLEVVGRMEVVYEVEDGVVEDLYRIGAASIQELDFDDPQAPTNFDPSADFSTGFLPEDSY